MNKFSLDYNVLEGNVTKKSFKLKDVEHRIVKVAFDVVKFTGDDTNKLWQIQSADDGDYIVSLYNSDEEPAVVTAAWDVVMSKTAGDLNFFYKGEHLVKVAGSNLGLQLDEINEACRMLPARLATNKNLVNSLLSEMNVSQRADVLKKYPELA